MSFKTSTVAQVHDESCVGCTVCANVCPSGAITMVDRLAVVDEALCVGCPRCLEACMPYGAITLIPDPSPKRMAIPFEDRDHAAVNALCAKARLDPNFPICVCTGTTAGETAAAIVQGATTPEDVTVATGVRAMCSIYCTAAVLRLFEANEVELSRPAKDYRVYTDTVTDVAVWSVPDDIADKYPEYDLRRGREAVDAGELELQHLMFPTIRRRPVE